ncbi:MAG: flagellar hook-associated protein FlgK [Burkholderiales bacterium]|nr:flagellar hook-associated protein FlgK [Burkholderiales bacterium]
MSGSLMSIGMRAMFANSAQLNTTGHNIANANVQGYSRQDVVLSTAQGQFTGAGFFGKGVNVVDVRRVHDEFLTMQARAARALASSDAARLNQLSGLEEVFPPGEQGLGYAMGDFFAAMVDLGNSPADTSARQAVLSRASDVANRFTYASNRLDVLAAGVRDDMDNAAKAITSLAQQVADLNDRIAGLRGLEQSPNDLLDQRDSLIAQIGEYAGVTTVNDEGAGTVNLFIGGQPLVVGARSYSVEARPDPVDASRSALYLGGDSGASMLRESALTGGSLAGLMRFQNKDLVDARNQLGQMAMAFATQVNEAQQLGLDLNEQAGGPLFAVGQPQVLPNGANRRDASNAFIASVGMSITDATVLQASDYELRADPDNLGAYLMTRLSDGADVALSDTDGDGVWNTDPDQGFTVTIGTPAPAAGESFLLRPVANAAGGMRRVLDDPDGIAAASPFQAATGASNTGTATVDMLRMTGGASDRALSTDITFGAPAADGSVPYSWTLSDGSTGTGTWRAGEPIEINGYALSLNGVPADGDTVSVAPTLHADTDNGNALAMSRLADERMVGRTPGAGGSTGGATVTDAYADLMADVGVRVQSARSASSISQAGLTQADNAVLDKSGVNLDEEAARLIQFQQGYQAAAKVLQVAQSIFDTMIQLSR